MKSGSPEAKEIGTRIKAAASSAGLSLQELGRLIGVSRPTIYAYASGTLRVSPKRLKQIAEVTGQSGAFFSPRAAAADSRRPLEELIEALLSNADLARAIEIVAREVETAAAYGRQHELAPVQRRLGNALLLDGDYLEAVGHLQAARNGFLARQQLAEAASCSQSLGYAFINTGRLDRAKACFEEAIEALAPDQRWKGEVSLAALAERTGDLADARTRLDRLLADEALSAAARTYVLANLASLHAAAGQWSHAEILNRQALTSTSGTTDQSLERFIQIGRCLLRQGQLEESSLWLARALDGARLLGDKARLGYAGLLGARLLFTAGYPAEARRLALQCHRDAILNEHRRSEAEARLLLAEIAFSRNELETAADYAAQTVAFCEAHQYPIIGLYARSLESVALARSGQPVTCPDATLQVSADALGAPVAWVKAACALAASTSDPDRAIESSREAIEHATSAGDLLFASAERKRYAEYLASSGRSEEAAQQSRICEEFSRGWTRLNIHRFGPDDIQTLPVNEPAWSSFGNP